jgi:hypothetical protein
MFHISPIFLGNSKILYPRIPDPEARAPSEDGATPRVCVAPTIHQCLVSRESLGDLTKKQQLRHILDLIYNLYLLCLWSTR